MFHAYAAGQGTSAADCSGRFQPVQCLDPARARAASPSPTRRQVVSAPLTNKAMQAKTVAGSPEVDRVERGTPETAESAAATQDTQTSDDALPVDRDELFGTGRPDQRERPAGAPEEGPAPGQAGKGTGLGLRGFLQFEPAYTYSSPGHWSRGVVRTQLETQGQMAGAAKWKASLRLDIDPVYYDTDFYPDAVKDDQQLELLVRETYLDVPLTEKWEIRLGRQHIIWGEVVGLFFADVVSAKDLRDFILPDFDILRIPQWAARAEFFAREAHLELLWIPYPSYDNIGKPGAEFYPFRPPDTPGFNQVLLDDERPSDTLSNTSYGLRASGLLSGWDLSAFYYRSTSTAPTFYRQVETTPTPTVVFQPRHDRIWQVGGTLGKDLRSFVVKGEVVFTAGRSFEVTRLSEPTGVVPQDTLDYIVGLDFALPYEGRLNLQAFQRIFFDHDPDILFDEVESGVSLLVAAKLLPTVEPQLLVIQGLNANDRMIRPRITWYPHQNMRVAFGVDVFSGPANGFFGRFSDSDRVYGEMRYSF